VISALTAVSHPQPGTHAVGSRVFQFKISMKTKITTKYLFIQIRGRKLQKHLAET